MRFDFDAYDKVFPAQSTPMASVESAVDTFKPTEAEAKAMDKKPGEDVMASVPGEDVKTSVPEVPPNDSAEGQPEGGNNE